MTLMYLSVPKVLTCIHMHTDLWPLIHFKQLALHFISITHKAHEHHKPKCNNWWNHKSWYLCIPLHTNTAFPLIVAPGAKTNFWENTKIKNSQNSKCESIFWWEIVAYCVKTRFNAIEVYVQSHMGQMKIKLFLNEGKWVHDIASFKIPKRGCYN